MAQIVSREETAMSYSISTLLKRNLQDVFGEGDPGAQTRSNGRDTLLGCATAIRLN
jgi:hypothetical protein